MVWLEKKEERGAKITLYFWDRQNGMNPRKNVFFCQNPRDRKQHKSIEQEHTRQHRTRIDLCLLDAAYKEGGCLPTRDASRAPPPVATRPTTHTKDRFKILKKPKKIKMEESENQMATAFTSKLAGLNSTSQVREREDTPHRHNHYSARRRQRREIQCNCVYCCD